MALTFAMALVGCGGGGSNSGMSSSATMSIAAGTTYMMPTDTSVDVPSGTTITAPNGTSVTINGSSNTVLTQVGAVVNVPADATGPANNTVSTGTANGSGISTSALSVTVLAGSATTNENPTDGTGTAAIFWGGGHLAALSSGDLIVSDRGSLRRVTPAGVVTTFEGPSPYDWEPIAIDGSGNIYGSGNQVLGSDSFGASIAEWTHAGSIQGLYQDWETGSVSVGWGGLARDAAGSLYLADAGTNRLLKFDPAGGWAVLAGNGSVGSVDGTGTAASLTIGAISDLPIDADGNLYLNTGTSIRKITPTGTVTTLFEKVASDTNALALDAAGNFYVANFSSIVRFDGTGNMTSFPFPNTTDFITSMTIDADGNLYLGTRGIGAQIFKVVF
jgi:sugar lactone lactonase YvrE